MITMMKQYSTIVEAIFDACVPLTVNVHFVAIWFGFFRWW